MLQAPTGSLQLLVTRWRHTVLVLVTLALSAYIDVVTGYEVSVFLLYTIPVAIATRRLGNAVGLAVSVAATLLWIWSDVITGHAYSHQWFLYMNAFNRFVCFLLTMATIRYVSIQKDELMARIRAFSGEVPVCQQCHRVGADDGYWRSFENYLTEFGQAKVSNKVCPDCARRTYARAAYCNHADQVG
ncbi:MAG: hypothetical protein QM749_08320 [Aquabacterium sp.]